MLDSLCIPRIGTYRNESDRSRRYPMIIEKNGFRIVLLNYTYATNGLIETPPRIVNRIDRRAMRQDIAEARAIQPDAIIACMHWGTEYELLPDKSQKQLADWLLGQGVTHIIGNHPHVVQPMELRTDSTGRQHVVVYSLGNFISNMSRTHTDGGAAFTLVLEKDSTGHTRIARCCYDLVWTADRFSQGIKDSGSIPYRPRKIPSHPPHTGVCNSLPIVPAAISALITSVSKRTEKNKKIGKIFAKSEKTPIFASLLQKQSDR